MKRQLVCIQCPLGCGLEVDSDAEGQIVSVTGNGCSKGLAYAENEIHAPKRTVTTTIRIRGSALAFLPVKTVPAVPKERTRAVVAAASALTLKAPVFCGEIVCINIAETGSALVATYDAPLLP